MHVHLVGNGAGGSGCRLHVRGGRRLLVRWMARQVGLPSSALVGDLERAYLERLMEQVRSSSLEAIVVLAQEEVYTSGGERREDLSSYYVPNGYVLDAARRHPELLPGVSIHPARADALEELERCLEGGAVLMKCLPMCQNIDCNDRRYKTFWRRMADAGLPLLAHTGSEHTLPVVRPELADPSRLTLPLECGVTVIAAHCATASSPFACDYFPVFVDLLERYPNLYGDISAFHVPFRSRHMRACLKPPVVDRLLHGSDYPVPVHGFMWRFRRWVDHDTYQYWQRCPNALERDYQLKRAAGFPEEVFTRVHDLLRNPAHQY